MSWINTLSTDESIIFDSIKNSLSQHEGRCLEALYTFIFAELEKGVVIGSAQNKDIFVNTVEGAIAAQLAYSMNEFHSDPNSDIDKSCLLKLKAIGLVFSRDDINFGLTKLGVDFITAMRQSS